SATLLAQQRATSRLVVGYEPSFAQRYFLTASVSDPDVARPLLSVPGERHRVGLSALWRSPDQQDRFFVQANAFRTSTRTGDFAQLRLAVSAQQGPWRLTPFVREDRASTGALASRRTFGGTEFFATLPRTAGRALAGGLVRGQLERDVSGAFAQGSAFFGQLFRGWLRVEVGATWFANTRPVWLLTINGDRAQVRTLTTASATPGLRAGGSQTVQGSVVYERRTRRVDFWRGPAIERAGLVGRVYTDLDGDGRFGPGDEPVGGATVRAGGLAARTDDQGRYRLWDLVPFEPIIAEVDLSTVASPLWVPKAARIAVTPEPHRYTPLDLVLEPGGTIEGMVVQRVEGREFGLGGVPVTLTREGEDSSRTVTTFGDGAFAALALRTGRWRVAVAPAFLERAGLQVVPVAVTLRSSLDGDQPAPVTVRLRPNPLLDRDADGVFDDDDACPATSPGTVVDARGCGEPPPLDGDADGDGVQDSRDACPGTPAGTVVDARGCRAVFAPAQRTLVLRGVRFETGRAILSPESFAVLDDIALALRDDANVRVEVGGHTDSTGSAATNRRLSQQRAEVVRYYLIRRGVAASQLTARGYGPARPVAPNTTPAGRALNRRTELTRLDAPAPRREP
nr:OmpA family protein [Gemmatimonadaceae bacterium]